MLGEKKKKNHLYLHVTHDFTGFMTESIEEIMKEIMDIIFKRWEVFKQLEMASKSENIETVREKKVTLDNLAETFQLFNNAFDYFYDIKKAEH